MTPKQEEKIARDLIKIMDEFFYCHGRHRDTISNQSHKTYFEDVINDSLLTLLVIAQNNTDLSVGDSLTYRGKSYIITQIEKENRLLNRLFLREE